MKDIYERIVSLNFPHREILDRFFRKPIPEDISWADAQSLIEALEGSFSSNTHEYCIALRFAPLEDPGVIVIRNNKFSTYMDLCSVEAFRCLFENNGISKEVLNL